MTTGGGWIAVLAALNEKYMKEFAVNVSLTHPEISAANLAVRYVRPLFDWRTYLNLLYLVLAFPLGLVYFVTLVVGFAVGVPLLIIWIGALVLLFIFVLWWLFLVAERQLAIWLLGEEIAPMVLPAAPDETVLRRALSLIANPVTWKGLLFLLLKFPLGIVSFTLSLFIIAFTATTITAPLTYWFAEINIGFWRIDTLPEAVIVALLGLLLAPFWALAVNFFARIFGVAARWSLGRQDWEGPTLPEEPLSEPGQTVSV